ncbi:hypothetical protein FF011L_37140 [Roseimaritima multifibrata]|uniref:Uncharacterized protein n=1 Tax=Roseimaritima multifibrata TaxID=1930274 RepID=A0A517MJA9_9BACT|nr:hypothetical protein [Roseimaritima multifibrata]QDS94930.1 hypothetical protein FF011L_37140 [Roseimaritima multifibrata]
MPEITFPVLKKQLPPAMVEVISATPLSPLDAGDAVESIAKYIAVNGDLERSAEWNSLQIDLVCSGLWLLAGELDRSHDISQSIKTPEGSFLHGIMHRREGDFGNSKYWFRQVGPHAVYAQIAQAGGGVPEELQADGALDPYAFVDACQSAVRGKSNARPLEQIQWNEWQALMADILPSE